MSIVLTRIPLEQVGMNGAGQKRRSARLSHEGDGENEPAAKKSKANGATMSAVSTKQQDGETKATSRRKKAVYEEEVGDFNFSKKSKKNVSKQPAVRNSLDEATVTAAAPEPVKAPTDEAARPSVAEPLAPPRTARRKTTKRLPESPERETAGDTVRRSKRLSSEKEPEHQASPQRPAHAQSHTNIDRSPSPARAAPVNVEKKRKPDTETQGEGEKIVTISLAFADTPVIRRNREMRKASKDGHRRSSAGMRGKRASSVIDEGRGHALPHSEVPVTEFFKHISADLTEPRRMRCLLGWCGTRCLPPKPDAPKSSTPAASLEFQALQAARVIQEELSLEFVSNGTLSDWFSRDEISAPLIPTRKKANPRNIANANKAEELEGELERLKTQRAEWDEVVKSTSTMSISGDTQQHLEISGVSPLQPELLSSPQRTIFEQLNPSTSRSATDPQAIEQRLRTISDDLEFAVDMFAHGVHALSTTRETAERAAEKSLADAANVLEEREKQRAASGESLDQMNSLRGLARVLNSQQKRP